MNTWIFQGSPDRFEVEDYLTAGHTEIVWSVSRYAKEITPGDLVYLWRATGRSRKLAGILGSATVLTTPAIQSDDQASSAFNVDRPEAAREAMRVKLRLNKVIRSNREIIRRDWLKDDPICAEMSIIKQPAASNFRLTHREADRIAQLWAKTGVTWSREEAIAALGVYEETYKKKLSKLKASPVSNLALLCGRSVGSAYNKVLNYRAIDPRDERAGLSGAGDGDRAVWREFYDPETARIDTARLRDAFDALWPNAWVKPSAVEQYDHLAASEVAAVGLDLASLEANLRENPPRRRPRSALTTATVFDRDARVAALAKMRAGFSCEVPGCTTPLFIKPDGNAYVEAHHIKMLAQGGEDVPENVACLCPNHHRELHYGEQSSRLRQTLIELRRA